MIYYADQLRLVPINLPDNFDMTKVIQEQDGMKQKVDEQGNLLYTKYETTQKTNEAGELIYLDGDIETTASCRNVAMEVAEIEDENGEIVEIPEPPVYVDNNPLMIEVPVETIEPKIAIAWETQTVTDTSYVQKTDEAGNPLYMDWTNGIETIEDWSTGIVDEYGTELDRENEPIMIPVENGTKEVQVPTEWLDYEPVMVPNMVDVSIKFSERPEEFTVDAIITEKFRLITEAVGATYCLADCFLTMDDLNLSACERVDTGVKLVSLQPYGMAETMVLQLDVPARVFKVYVEADANIEVYINASKVENGTVDLLAATEEVFITFMETQGKRGNVSAYALLYDEEVVQ